MRVDETGSLSACGQLDLRTHCPSARVAAHLRMERNDRRVGCAGLDQCGWLSHCGISLLSRLHLEEQTGMTSKTIALILTLVLAALPAPLAAEAQTAAKVWRIGLIVVAPASPLEALAKASENLGTWRDRIS